MHRRPDEAALAGLGAVPPSEPLTIRLRRDGLPSFFDPPGMHEGVDKPLRLIRYEPGAVVPLPPLPLAHAQIAARPTRQRPFDWADPVYRSMESFVFEVRDAIVHTSYGVLGLGGRAVAECFNFTDPIRHRYRHDGADVILEADAITPLPGTHVCLLGSGQNYFHLLLDCLCRLAALTPEDLAGVDGLLLPGTGPIQREFLDLSPLPPGLARREVGARETLQVERLLIPWALQANCCYHPAVLRAFDAISARVPEDGRERPRRLYVDRGAAGAAGARRLENEDAVAAALVPLGFEAVRLDGLSLSEQVRLFRGADAIVAPHGAGLTNLVFARPGCRVLELHMDAYLHTSFRNLSALRGLSYDCLIGSAGEPWPEEHRIHNGTWRIDPERVARTALGLLDGLVGRGVPVPADEREPGPRTDFQQPTHVPPRGRGDRPMHETSIRVVRDEGEGHLRAPVRLAFERALALHSHLPARLLAMPGMSGRLYRRFINNLCGLVPDARYLEVGSWTGSTACAAMHGNRVAVTCIDNWSQFGGSRAQFEANVADARTEGVRMRFIENDFRAVDYAEIGRHNVFLFDGPHGREDQRDGILLALPALDDEFVLVVDDWNYPPVAPGTLDAFQQARLRVLYAIEVRSTQDGSHPQPYGADSPWHNGYFIAVVTRRRRSLARGLLRRLRPAARN